MQLNLYKPRLFSLVLILFCLQAQGQNFRFVVFGDFNGGGCDRNKRVADTIAMMAAEPNVDFFISTGDLIDGYAPNGNLTSCFATDPATQGGGCPGAIPNGSIRSMLSPLANRTPAAGLNNSFFPTIGNHDDNWGSNWYPDPCGDGICDLLRKGTETDTQLVSRYINSHDTDQNICSKDPSISDFSSYFYYQFVHQNNLFIILRLNDDNYGMFSCNNLPGSYPDCPSYCSDPSLFNDPARNNNCYSIHQYDWLREQLDQADQQSYDHIFVFAHAPLLGNGDGHLPTSGAAQYRALLEQHNVDIYFNGHNHAYERTHKVTGNQLDPNGTAYITSGVAGAAVNGNADEWFTAATYRNWTFYGDNSGGTSYEAKMSGYLIIDVTPDGINGQFKSLGMNGQVTDSFNYGSAPATDMLFLDDFEGVSAPPTDPVPSLGGCSLFPADNFWNTAIDTLDVHPLSSNYINSIGAATTLHPDFGTTWQGTDIGIPYDIVPANQTAQAIKFTWWDESDLGDTSSCNTSGAQDTGCYPIPASPSIEGGSDNHILLLQQQSCMLYEVFNTRFENGQWLGDSGAIWDLSQNQVRPEGWTSADASGLAILPGLVRYDEVVNGQINHALRITLNTVQAGYIRPASHSDGQGGNDPNRPPMGLRLRLKASFDISSFDPEIQTILRAMKKYGIVIADTGSDMFLSGMHHDLWDDDQLRALSQVTAADFEAVYTGDVIPYP